MNSLEWINFEINFCKQKINKLKGEILYQKTMAILLPKNNINLTLVNEFEISLNEEKIKYLQQIKTELEVWYICKQHAHINKYEDINKNREKERFDITIWLNTENCDFESCASYEDCLKVKKALEVNK